MSQPEPSGKNDKDGAASAVRGTGKKHSFAGCALGTVGFAFLVIGLLVTLTLLPCVTMVNGVRPLVFISIVCATPLLIGAILVYAGFRLRNRN